MLVTTNEEIKKLHPAVARPGRCATAVQFLRPTEPAAGAWLEAHGLPVCAARGQTVAELHSLLEGGEQPRSSEQFDDESSS